MINERWLRKRYLTDKVPVAAIAQAAGVHPSTIYRALDHYEIPRRGKPGARIHRLDPKLVAEQRSDGLTWQRIGTLAGADRSSVVWHAAQHGLYDLADDPRRYRRAVRVAEKYRRGHSIASIAATFGVHRRHVTIWLRALGVNIRRPGRPPATAVRSRATTRAASRKRADQLSALRAAFVRDGQRRWLVHCSAARPGGAGVVANAAMRIGLPSFDPARPRGVLEPGLLTTFDDLPSISQQGRPVHGSARSPSMAVETGAAAAGVLRPPPTQHGTGLCAITERSSSSLSSMRLASLAAHLRRVLRGAQDEHEGGAVDAHDRCWWMFVLRLSCSSAGDMHRCSLAGEGALAPDRALLIRLA